MAMNMELSETYYQQYKTNDQRNNLISPQDKKKRGSGFRALHAFVEKGETTYPTPASLPKTFATAQLKFPTCSQAG